MLFAAKITAHVGQVDRGESSGALENVEECDRERVNGVVL